MRDWRKNSLRDFLRRLLLFDESPHRTSLAFAVGVFIGFTPLWGLHTAIGLIASVVARLNRVAVLIGVWVNTPWTMAPAASLGAAIGFLILGMDVEMPELPRESFVSSEFWHGTWIEFRPLLWPFLIGNIVLAVTTGALAYLVMRRILTTDRARHSKELENSSPPSPKLPPSPRLRRTRRRDLDEAVGSFAQEPTAEADTRAPENQK